MSLVVLKVGGASAGGAAEAVARLRAAGTAVCVVHGAGPQISEEMERRGLEVQFVGGRRVTTPEALEVVRDSFAAVNAELCRTIGPDAVPLAGDEIGLEGDARSRARPRRAAAADLAARDLAGARGRARPRRLAARRGPAERQRRRGRLRARRRHRRRPDPLPHRRAGRLPRRLARPLDPGGAGRDARRRRRPSTAGSSRSCSPPRTRPATGSSPRSA